MSRNEDGMTGRLIGDRYVLGEKLGEGGMGVVYMAEQIGLERTVAIKMLRDDLASESHVLRRFLTEARAGSRLSHRNLVTVHDFGTLETGTPYLVMEHVRGESLSNVLAACGTLSMPRALDLVGQVLDGLAEAHAHGVIHGDVKTDNILVERAFDGREIARLIDFGLACFADDPPLLVNGERLLSGTPEYVAPEVILGAPPTRASDVYGAAIVLYELLTGTTPFAGGTTAEILARQLDEDVVPPSLRNPEQPVPEELEAVIMRALAKQPSQRPRDVRELAKALAAAAPGVDRSEAVTTRIVKLGFSTEAPTRNLEVSEDIAARRRVAAGTRPQPATRTQDFRAELGASIARGDVAAIVTGYLGLARSLVDEHRLPAAARELEEAIDLLTRGDGPMSPDAPEPVWRVLLALAAIYAGTGDPRADRAAADAREVALRARSSVGCERAHALLQRFARVAHGA